MAQMERTGLFDSIFTRLVAWAIAISIAVVLVLGWIVTAKFQENSDDAVQWSIHNEMDRLSDVLEERGRDELIVYIEDAASIPAPAGSATHYLLLDDDGNRLAGDLAAVPDIPEDEIGGDVMLPGRMPAYAWRLELAPGLMLVVAKETSAQLLQVNQIGLTFVGAGLIVVFAVGVAGYVTARRLSQRVRLINAAFRHPDPKRLAALGTGHAERDEIGEVTRHSSAALTRLDRLMRAQRDTTDQIAHEMRTPLMHLDTRLVKAIQAQETAKTPDPETTERLIDARSEIRRVVATLESLLDIAHSEADVGNPRGLEDVDLTGLATRIADLYGASAEDTGHHFLLEAEEGVTMLGDEIQLSRLITNLLDNAFKYVPAGGTVRLIVRHGPHVIVADDGPGIPEEFRETVFRRFGRGAEDGNHDSRGAGLGLALARAIAIRHDMELRLAPSTMGARFEMRPAPPAPSEAG